MMLFDAIQHLVTATLTVPKERTRGLLYADDTQNFVRSTWRRGNQ